MVTTGRAGDLPFPPLGNPGAWSLASAPVHQDPAFIALRNSVEHLPDGPCAEVVAAFEPWLAAAVRTANDQRFRLELTGLHAEGLAPTLSDVRSLCRTGYTGTPALAAGRGTAKLVVLLGVRGTGRSTVTASGMDADVELSEGVIVVAPAYAVLDTGQPVDGDLRVLCCSVAGPALR